MSRRALLLASVAAGPFAFVEVEPDGWYGAIDAGWHGEVDILPDLIWPGGMNKDSPPKVLP